MEALWRKSPLSADEVLADVKARQPWGDATVKTLINRLLKKAAIASERGGHVVWEAMFPFGGGSGSWT